MLNKKGKSYYFCWGFFLAFVIFLYGPTFTIVVLSFQGPEGGLTFPMNGFSFHWFHKLWEGGGYVGYWLSIQEINIARSNFNGSNSLTFCIRWNGF